METVCSVAVFHSKEEGMEDFSKKLEDFKKKAAEYSPRPAGGGGKKGAGGGGGESSVENHDPPVWDLLGWKVIADCMGVSRSTAIRLAKDQSFPLKKLGGQVMSSSSAIDLWIKRQPESSSIQLKPKG